MLCDSYLAVGNRGQCANLDKIRRKAVYASATPTNADIENVLQKLGEPLLSSFECFDVFSDPSGQIFSSDRRSLAYRFLYRAPDRTLKAEEVDAAHQKVLEALTTKLGVKFR